MTNAKRDVISHAAEPPVDREFPLAAMPAGMETMGPPVDGPFFDSAEIAVARGYADASRASSTQRAYAADWRCFTAWCLARNVTTRTTDPHVVALFFAAEAEAGTAPLTVGRGHAAIGWMHGRDGLQPPQIREGAAAILEVMAEIRRHYGVAPTRINAADAEVLRDILRGIVCDDLRSVRSRTVLVLGMAGAFRRSDLVALRYADPRCVPEGLRITTRRRKTDQVGAGATIAIPDGRRLRPKALLEAWIDEAGITDGFPFRRLSAVGTATAAQMLDRAVARLMQAPAGAAGHDAAVFAGRSLRTGFLTAAARCGASVSRMRDVSRHKSMQALADYVRNADLVRDNAGEGFL